MGIGLSVKADGALVHGNDTGENVHQGGFARTVFAQQGVDFTGANLQVYVRQGVDTAEGFGNALHLQNGFHKHFSLQWGG